MRHSVPDALQVSAGEIARNFGRWQDRALIQPIVVTNHGRPRVVIVSAEDYAAFDHVPGGFAERADGAQDAQLLSLLENMTGAFIALDTTLKIIIANHAFELMSGRPAAQLIDRTLEECFPDSRPLLAEHLRLTLRSGERGELHMHDSRFPERTYHVRTFAYPGGVAALIRNNTAERELQEATHREVALRAALARLPGIGVVSLNIRGVFTQVDDGFTRQTGFSLKDLATARLIDIVRPSDRHAVAQALEKSLQGGEPASFSTTLLVKQLNERPFQVSLAPIAGDGMPEGVAAVFTCAA